MMPQAKEARRRATASEMASVFRDFRFASEDRIGVSRCITQSSTKNKLHSEEHIDVTTFIYDILLYVL